MALKQAATLAVSLSDFRLGRIFSLVAVLEFSDAESFRTLGFRLPAETFPDGLNAMAMLVFGWFWPLVIVGITGYLERRKRRTEDAV